VVAPVWTGVSIIMLLAGFGGFIWVAVTGGVHARRQKIRLQSLLMLITLSRAPSSSA
jgi:hypothetical protein